MREENICAHPTQTSYVRLFPSSRVVGDSPPHGNLLEQQRPNETLLYSSETNKKRQEKRRRLFLGWLIDQVSDKSASSRADGLYSRPSKQQQRQDGVDSSKSIGTSAHYSTCVRDGRRRRRRKKRVASPTTPPLLLRMTCSWFPKGQVFVVPAKINSLRGSCPPPSQSGTSLVVAPRSHPTAAQLSRWCWWWELPSAPVYVLFFSLYSFLVPFFSARKDNGSQLNATDTHTQTNANVNAMTQLESNKMGLHLGPLKDDTLTSHRHI